MKPSVAQWTDLYEVAKNIRKIAPWEYLWDSNLITIMLPEREEPLYCSTMGRGGECYAIGIYIGYAGLESYMRIANRSMEDEPDFVSAFEQNCLLCNFGDREELEAQDRDVLKSLNLRFRGRNEWIYFRTMRPGHYPWHIDSADADLMIKALQNYAMACSYLFTEKLSVDFENGETLLRFYSPEQEMWLNTAAKMPVIAVERDLLIIDDQEMIDMLNGQKKTKAALELEVTYLPAPIQENKNEAPYLPKMIMLADKKSGRPLGQHMSQPDEEIEQYVLGVLISYIEKHGRPAVIYVRDDRAGCFISDLCRKIDVKLVKGEGVPAIDSILTGMLNFIGF